MRPGFSFPGYCSSSEIRDSGIDVLRTNLVERAAFPDPPDFGGTLSRLGPEQANNVEKAIRNAREFAGEVTEQA